jgi:PAS domain S-box-containing protein
MNSDPHIESNTEQEQDEWLIDDDGLAPVSAPELAPWAILIVDDDVDVHVVTKFSLRNVTYKGRPLTFLHAYSGKEGLNTLRTTPDIALVLLDVVMETENAGLTLARQIRGELDNQVVRVVLRTGQSGQAMEQSVIVDYDINDYRTKSDLTTQKLFTTVISSLRAYDSLLSAAASQQALKNAQSKIRELRFALDQHTLLSVTGKDGRIMYVNDRYCAWSDYSVDELLGREHSMLLSPDQQGIFLQEIWLSLKQGMTWQGELDMRIKDGSTHKLEATFIPLLDGQAKANSYLAVYSEISAPRA